MAIPDAARGTPIPRVNQVAAFVDVTTGALSEHGLQVLDAIRNFIVGMNRVTPCSATGTNVITLQPNDAAPLIEKYLDHEVFAFVAAATSTGAVTMTVVPRKGALDTLPVYITDGGVQANTGDIVSNRLYLAIYHSQIVAGGGFIVK